MTVTGVVAAVLAALLIGYLYGRHAGSSTPTWRRRTSRLALGRQAVELAALVAIAHMQRRAARSLPALLSAPRKRRRSRR